MRISIALGLSILSLALSAAGVLMSIHLARRWGVLDTPKERSSHSTPIPKLGGLPMVASAILCFALWVILAPGEAGSSSGIFGTLLFACGISILGLFDDLFDLSPGSQLFVQFAQCLFCLWMFSPVLPAVYGMGDGWIRYPLIAAVIVWCVWMVNLYNFMDGIDGLAGSEAAMVSLFFFFLFAWEGEPVWAVANLVISASAMGFLLHNWPPAKVFMGGAGSTFLGAFYGMQSLVAPVATGVPFIVLVLPFSNFILDTTFTLVRRVLKGEKWYQAHRTHVYQRLTNLGRSHRDVTVMELIAAAASCLAAAACMHAGVYTRFTIPAVVFIGLAAAGFHFLRKEEREHAGSSGPSR